MTDFKSNWWKILGIILLLYSVVFGLGVPLKHGILQVDQFTTKSNTQLKIKVEGYNSHYDEYATSAWLKIDSVHYIESNLCRALSATLIECAFYIPPHLPSKDSVVSASLIIDNKYDGYAILPEAIFIEQHIIDVSKGESLWSPSGSLENIHINKEFKFPFRNILHETVRNTFYHVSLWFAMFILLIASLVYAVKYLRQPHSDFDKKAYALNAVAILYGILGLITGSIWAKYTWGTFWTTDVKLNMTAVAMLIYFAYLILRQSINDVDRRARLSAVYSIFAFIALIALVFVIPRLTDSLHPGNGGNPALGGEDLDNTLRMVFYPSIIGLTLIGIWIAELKFRLATIEEKVRMN